MIANRSFRGELHALRDKYLSFVVISGLGLAIATVTLWTGVNLLGMSPFAANFIGDVLAVTFVFVTSARRTFVH